MEPKVQSCITGSNQVRALLDGGGYLESQTVEAHLLYAILNTLESIQAQAK